MQCENLWAPWRGQYVTGVKSDGCVFCEKGAVGADDEMNYLIHRGDTIFIIMNLYPYNNGHIMLIPYRHISNVTDMTGDEMQEMSKLLQLSLNVLKVAINPQGFNVGYNIGAAAGAGIAGHLHQHIVPRWQGDTNFMPVIANVKVISEHMDITYKKIKDVFGRHV